MKNTNDGYQWPMAFFEEHHNRLASGFSQWQCPKVHHDSVIGQPGSGFKIAMSTAVIFRRSFDVAGLGVGRRAFDKTLKHTKSRSQFGATITAMLGVQAKLADMIIDLETAALVIYWAGWSKNVTGGRCAREASWQS